MSERSKYSLNGVYKCGVYVCYRLFYVFRYIACNSTVPNSRTCLFPLISHDNHPKVQVRAYFNIIKKHGSSAFERKSEHLNLKSNGRCKGLAMDIGNLYDRKTGFLSDGVLSVEYGFQVESVEGHDEIWRFKFFDKFFNWENQNNMFQFTKRDEYSLFGHEQIVKLHSKKISDSNKDWIRVPKSITVEELIMCLQITHGVRLQMTAKEFERMIKIAFHFDFLNTVRYCEQKLIEIDEQPKPKIRNFKTAVKYMNLIFIQKKLQTAFMLMPL